MGGDVEVSRTAAKSVAILGVSTLGSGSSAWGRGLAVRYSEW